MTKPHVFIGSSKEGKDVADELQLALEPDFRCTVWDQGIFLPGHSFLEDLSTQLESFDFAVLVLTPDDTIARRDALEVAPRDNVIFESGLFLGHLGRERTILLRPSDIEGFHLFSDYLGISTPRYDYGRFKEEGPAALGAATTLIKRSIRRLGPKPRVNPDDSGLENLAAMYRSTGLTYAFAERHEATPKMLDDIKSAKRSIDMYSRVYISNILKDPPVLGNAIASAATRADLALNELRVRHVSTDGRTDSVSEDLAQQTWKLEDPMQEEWKTIEEYKAHLRRSDAFFDKLYERLRDRLGSVPPRKRARIRLERRYLVKAPLPYSVLSIDRSIFYVSFYSLSPTRHGTFAPTMRLMAGDGETQSWASLCLEFVRHIDDTFSCDGRRFNLI